MNEIILSDFIKKVSLSINDLNSLYKGLIIESLSIEVDINNIKSYQNKKYVSVSYEELNQRRKKRIYKATLIVSEDVLESAFHKGYEINKGSKVSVTIKSISLNNQSNILIEISNITRTGVSEREAYLKKLDLYCKKNGYYHRIKKNLPTLIKSIAIISTEGSTIQSDIINICNVKEISLYEANNSSSSIANFILEIDKYHFDLIVLSRGGREDNEMMIFSDIEVIESIQNIHTPIVSALGHEIDNPFIENIVDYSFKTPTDFANNINLINNARKKELKEILAPNLKKDISNIKNTLKEKLEYSYHLVLTNINNSLNLINNSLKNKHINIDLSLRCLQSEMESFQYNQKLYIQDYNNGIKNSLIYSNKNISNRKKLLITSLYNQLTTSMNETDLIFTSYIETLKNELESIYKSIQEKEESIFAHLLNEITTKHNNIALKSDLMNKDILHKKQKRNFTVVLIVAIILILIAIYFK